MNDFSKKSYLENVGINIFDIFWYFEIIQENDLFIYLLDKTLSTIIINF